MTLKLIGQFEKFCKFRSIDRKIGTNIKEHKIKII